MNFDVLDDLGSELFCCSTRLFFFGLCKKDAPPSKQTSWSAKGVKKGSRRFVLSLLLGGLN